MRTFALVLVLMLGAGCAVVAPFDDDGREDGDTIAPASVGDLELAAVVGGQLLLRWTAPGDDGYQGTARAYDLRFQPDDASPLEWVLAPRLSLPPPGPAKSQESVELDPLFLTGNWLFTLRTVDDADNWSRFAPPLLVEESYRPYPAPATESQLVENLARAWSSLDSDEYERLLGPDFQFWFAPEDIDLLENALYWDRGSDLQSAAALFGGESGTRPDGSVMPPADSIQVTLTPFDEEWLDASGEVVGGLTPLPEGTRRRRYDSEIRVHHTEESLVSLAVGSQVFYVVPIRQGPGGASVRFELMAWQDYGNWRPAGSSVLPRREPVTWGQIKFRY